MMSCGVKRCPSCGAAAEYIDPRTVTINRAKLEALGDLLPGFRRLASASARRSVPPVLVTDQQLLAYINRNRILSGHLLDECKSAARAVDTSTEAAARSPESRAAFEALLRQMREIRRVYDELDGIRAPEQFGDLHCYLQVLYQALLDFHLVTAETVLVLTIEEGASLSQRLQLELDRATEATQAIAEEVRRADPQAADASLDGRLAHFTGRGGEYEHDGRPDFAAVLSAGLQGPADVATLGREGDTYFGPMLAVDPAALAPEEAMALYLLAAEVTSSDDPVTLRRRASLVLEVLREAHHRDPAALASAMTEAAPDLEGALVTLLGTSDKLRALSRHESGREAQRLALTETYVTLVEGIFGRLLTLLLNARFALVGKAEPYADTTLRTLSDKLQILSQDDQKGDARYAPALLGVSMIARNAGAHGGVDTAGGIIRLRNINPKTKAITTEALTDEEFAARLADLTLTCQALQLAYELFRIEHRATLPAVDRPSAHRVLAEGARALVGYWGMTRAEVGRDDTHGTTIVEASAGDGQFTDDEDKLLIAVLALALLFRESTEVRLVVTWPSDARRELAVATADAAGLAAVPEDVKSFSILKVRYLASLPHDPAAAARWYERELIGKAALLMTGGIAGLQALRTGLPATAADYRLALYGLLHQIEYLRAILVAVPAPRTGQVSPGRLLAGLALLRKGLQQHGHHLRAGRWPEIQGLSPLLQDGTSIIVGLAS